MIPQTSSEVDIARRCRPDPGSTGRRPSERAVSGTRASARALLKYIVEHTLAGENDLLRERVIGTEVFGRSPDYEPGDDPVVRVAGRRGAEAAGAILPVTGPMSFVRIDIPPGSYKAVFQWKADQLTTPASPEPVCWKSRWRWVLVAVLIAVIAASAMVVRGLRTTPSLAPSAMDQFWAPALTSPKPILVYNATTPIFRSPDLTSSAHEPRTRAQPVHDYRRRVRQRRAHFAVRSKGKALSDALWRRSQLSAT